MDRVTYWYVALCISVVSCFARTFLTNQILLFTILLFILFQSAVKGLTMGGLNVVSITDSTPIMERNCQRPRKAKKR